MDRRRTYLSALLALAVVACDAPDRGPRWKAAGATAPRAGGTLRFSSKDAIGTLDPAYSYDEVSRAVLHPLLDTLVDFEPGGVRLVPRLAARWELSSDGRTYHFWLRDGSRYADGTPITALDFEHAIERPLRRADSPYGSFLADVEGAADVLAGKATDCTGVRAIGPRELEIRLVKPNAAFLYVLALKFTAPLPAAYAARIGDQLRRRPLASGPYQLAAWAEGERVELVRNPYYFDASRQRPERIVMLENVPRDTQFLMFERGELDTVERLTAADQLWIASRPDWRPYVQTMPQLNTYGARMDVRKPPFSDRRVRQALNYALNKRDTTKLLTGTSTPAHGMLPPGMSGRDDALAPYPYDPAKARALLAEAGYARGLVLEYTTIPDEDAAKLAASMQADFAAVGVTLRVSVIAFAAYLSQVGRADGGLPFSFAGWTADFPDPSSFIDVKFHSRAISAENSLNDSFYANRELDALLDEARGERDAERRAALYRRAERILYDDAPWIWNYHQLMTEVSQPYVRGYTLHPLWLRDATTAWLDLGPDGAPVRR